MALDRLEPMDDVVRGLMTDPAWQGIDRTFTLQPADLAGDYAGRVIALLVDRLGGQVTIEPEEIDAVVDRLMLLPVAVDAPTVSRPTLALEVRRLAGSGDIGER